ncbi:hypothetical protein [Bacillus thermotolerans]|nr:hypothetical protein [Bacillus thermotolerans]
MLPDHYCDYLLTLYTEGEEMPKDSVESMPPWPFVLMSQILAVCSIVISLFVLYFTELSFPLQMMILTIFVVCVLAAIIYFSKKEFFSPLLLVSAAVLLLIFTVEIQQFFLESDRYTLYALLFLHFLLWWGIGRKLRQLYLTISAYIGVFFLVIYIII